MVLAVCCLGLLLYFYIRGISKSLFEDDTKTAQNRIASAYYFLKMLIPGLVLLILLIFIYKIKVRVLPLKMANFLGYHEDEVQEEETSTNQEETPLQEEVPLQEEPLQEEASEEAE